MKSSTKGQKNGRDGNRLFPVFVKLEVLNVLIVGGGNVATEKLAAILRNSPSTSIRIVSKTFSTAIKKLAATGNVVMSKKAFDPGDLTGADLIFSAVNDIRTSKQISDVSRQKKVLHNAADKPDLCDFYLGSIVAKGNLKIGISTNGKSPTLAKRLKKLLEGVLPDELDEVLLNLAAIRGSLKGDLRDKTKQLNHITSILVSEPVAIKKLVRKGNRRSSSTSS